jgi:hypothetical protein
MGQLVFQATLGGQVNLVGPNTASTFNLNVPAVSSTLATLTGTETFTNKTLTSPTLTTPVLGTPSSGTLTNCTGLPNAGLVNSSVTVGSTAIALGATATTVAGLTSLATNTLTSASATALTLQSAGTTAVTIDTSQNVGIGTSSPATKLQVAGGRILLDNAQTYQSKDSGGTARDLLFMYSSNDVYLTNETANNLLFRTNATERMRIDSSGNVGIGSTSPTQKLTVNGSIQTLTNSTSFDQNGVQLDYASGAGRMAAYISTGSNLQFFTNPNAGSTTERMRIDSSGNLLVGTTSAFGSQKICVSFDGASFGGIGFVTTTNNTYSAAKFLNSSGSQVGSISVTNTLTAYNVSSDYRLKENIVPLTGALEKVAQLKPSLYNYKAEPLTNIEGFIAHELQSVIPHAVTGEKDETREEEYEVTPAIKDEQGNITTPAVMGTRTVPVYQGVDASFLIPHLTAAIQELKALVDSQSARIATLEAK